MELPPQLVTAAIQRATADSSSSENECSNSDTVQHNTTHYASSLLQQFVAQTQLLSNSASITTMGSSGTTSIPCELNSNPDNVGNISDCVLSQINNLPEISPIETNFLSTSQHLSPQQSEELSQIDKDLEEITSVSESVGLTIPNPPSLEDCVDNTVFMNLDITQGGSVLENPNDLLKTSPLTINSTETNSMDQADNQKLDTISTNSIESQEDVKNIVIESKRKRGRPRKIRDNTYDKVAQDSHKEDKSVVRVINDFHNNEPPNVSPDSGILSNHNSPTHSPMTRHELEESNAKISRKLPQKEISIRERRSVRSKSKTRSKGQRSDSSDSEYQKKKLENEIKQIKTEAPSPVPLKQEHNKTDKQKKNDHKLDIAALDRMLYATDRVLYPPRKKVGRKPQKAKAPKAPSTTKNRSRYDSADSDDESVQSTSVLSGLYAKRKELNSKLTNLPKKNPKGFSSSWRDNHSENEAVVDDPLDPTWKQIDLNPKYKDILSGYKSDHEFKPYKSCSRLIESGYKSDYGCRSGYKSDYFRSGYKSDHKSGYKSDKSGYKTDHSVRSMRRRMRKLKKSRSVRDRTYYKNQKHFVSDQEIVLLANKTFSSLTLGHSSSDSDCGSYLRKPSASPKYTSVSAKYPFTSAKHAFTFAKLNQKQILRMNSSDPFAPGPVFSGLQKQITSYNIFKVNYNNNNTLLKSPTKSSYIGTPIPSLKPAFTHKFGASPICVHNELPGLNSKKENDTLRHALRNTFPKTRKTLKNGANLFSSIKGDKSNKPIQIFEKAKNTYIPNKDLSRNVFLNFKKPHLKPSFHTKRHRRTVVLAPSKINLKPTERLSRISVKMENKHHRHRNKRRHRSRSASRCREVYTKSVENTDQKFNIDMDNLTNNFIKLCQVAPKIIMNNTQTLSKVAEKQILDNAPSKVLKRGSKKRKTSDNQEICTPSSKRRHKKQLTESQSKSGKDANEHKLPLKKRHYHINSSTNNSLSISLVTTEFEENLKNAASADTFLCTETNCMGELQNNVNDNSSKIKTSVHDKNKKSIENVKSVSQQIDGSQENSDETKSIQPVTDTKGESLMVQIEESTLSKNHSPNSSNCTDDELAIKKPTEEQSELSKKIYETSEKLKAVHKMVHDLEKSLPKSKESETKTEVNKPETNRITAPKSESKLSPQRNLAPIVTPKKRHRLEAEKIVSHSSLDQVVQSLSKKLSEEKVTNSGGSAVSDDIDLKETSKEADKQSINSVNTNVNNNIADPLKSMSARSLYKSSILPAQKSEIMTRKKNRLEGLTSNLVSKINPSAATKVLDTLLNNNIRKSIESRILEKEKTNAEEKNKVVEDKLKSKEVSQMNTRATVIKSPISKKQTIDPKTNKSEQTSETIVVVNVDRPTGIFEPSIDLEEQIPKSSICINTLNDNNKVKPKVKNNNENKIVTKASLNCLDPESDIPLSLISEASGSLINRPKRGESIAAVLSDKIQETTGGHNLRQAKRNISNETEDSNDKKKKKFNNIIRESKLVLPTKIMIPKVQAERLPITETTNKKNTSQENDQLVMNSNEDKNDDATKKKPKRRKTFNRTGFPNIKKKKKKIDSSNQNINPDSHIASESDNSSVFERVPKDGEAMSSFLERTSNNKQELKVVLNKDDCPKQGRLTVVALEKLQGKDVVEKVNKDSTIQFEKKKSIASILRAPSLQLKQNKNEKDQKNHINKWEVLSETDSIPSLTSSLGNDPEDSIPLSLLNVKSFRPKNQLDNLDRLKRKTRALSPSKEVEDLLFSKRRIVEKNNKINLRPKSSLAILCPNDRRLTRSSDNNSEELKNKIRKPDSKKSDSNKEVVLEKLIKPTNVVSRRKSRSCAVNKKNRELTSSSRDSSLDTLKGFRVTTKSRETSVDTLREHDENDPLPLNEKEIDFEKSIDVLSKNIICKKRVPSSRDDSPASSVERIRDIDKPLISKRNPRLRKKFLVAGLFSDYYKDDSKPDGKGKNLVNQTESPPGILPPPPYCERWVRRRLQHFTLPYDIWWQQHYNQPVPSWNYKKIRTNVYYDVKPSAEECESVACNCASSSGCPEDCINRLVFAECSPQLCPCGEKCRNQRIQKHEWASGLEKFMTKNKGWGVKTKHKIPAGDFILEYVGEVVSDKEFKERMATRYARDTHHYCLHLDGGLVIDGHRMGGDGRFVNHSCRPNCEMQKWTANGTFRMALFALRNIEPGEELTYDYNFSLFNPAVGQACKCDSEDCRGVIGGKSQRITKPPQKTQSRTPSNASTQSSSSNSNQHSRVGRPRKAVKCNKKSDQQTLSACDLKNMTILKYQQHLNKFLQESQVKPLTPKEKGIVKDRLCFLIRNLEKVRKIRDRLSIAIGPNLPSAVEPLTPPSTVPPASSPTANTNVNPLALPPSMNPSVFLTRLQALRAPRENAARRLPPLEDNPDLSKKTRLANIFRALHKAVVSIRDDKDELICAPLLKRKADRKCHDTAATATAADLAAVEANIEREHYGDVGQFDADMNAIFTTVFREHGRVSALGSVATQLKKAYNLAKSDLVDQLCKILGPDDPLPAGFLQKSKQEEVIMCICGLHLEEGLMVQCGGSGCGVWQHARCMRVADTTAPHFCHQCKPRPVDREIPLDDYTEEGHQFYLSLMRGDLQVRQGDTVYVLRDIPIDERRPDVSQKTDNQELPKTKRVDRKKLKNTPKSKEKDESMKNKEGEVRKHTYQTIGSIPVSELDIFRVERLWKHRETNERFVYGHHYLRPHETFHEPTRKFFPNEVMRVPLYEAVPIELVMSQCWVMDLNTYCKGRPVGASEEHVYICELRVDRTAHLFTRISRPKYPICTKAYAFDHFPQRLKISRTYAPHEVSPEYLKGRAAKNNITEKEVKPKSVIKEVKKKLPALPPIPETSKTNITSRERQKERVNNIARRLLARGGGRAALDASYLLDTRRRRRAS
ncbi:Histone-lysine N-methyltransferase ash1 [Eumeta japonica]|uniref:Histone-lysine N-methyltransferase ash1 n=1 Tax=Eumeta variegata TaxID=151549 RepID=A0A4C1T0C1_EUMVA|nr:Histone-lysine N-methyltransferase ash1 [Eumeta japonica]